MATLPSYVCILLDGYTEAPDYGVLRSDMEGLAKQRPRWSKSITTRDCQLLVESNADKILFDTWVRTDLNYGAGWFDYADPLDGQTKQARIVGGRYEWTSPGRIWVAQCQIETIG